MYIYKDNCSLLSVSTIVSKCLSRHEQSQELHQCALQYGQLGKGQISKLHGLNMPQNRGVSVHSELPVSQLTIVKYIFRIRTTLGL